MKKRRTSQSTSVPVPGPSQPTVYFQSPKNAADQYHWAPRLDLIGVRGLSRSAVGLSWLGPCQANRSSCGTLGQKVCPGTPAKLELGDVYYLFWYGLLRKRRLFCGLPIFWMYSTVRSFPFQKSKPTPTRAQVQGHANEFLRKNKKQQVAAVEMRSAADFDKRAQKVLMRTYPGRCVSGSQPVILGLIEVMRSWFS